MLSISLGPLALPMAPLLLLGAVWIAAGLASWRLRREARVEGPGRVALGHAGAAYDALWLAALIGLLAARIAHLALNFDAYAATPWLALDIRDGGWHAPTGAFAGAAWLAWCGMRLPALRRPLVIGALAGSALWLAATLGLGLRDQPSLPAIMVTELATDTRASLPQFARGRPVVLNLWASWCGPCREEMPMLAQAQQREPGIAFLFVNQGESADTVRAYLAREHLPLREVLLDAQSQLLPAVGSRGLPTTVFFDAGGRQVDAHFGALNAAALQSRLRALR